MNTIRIILLQFLVLNGALAQTLITSDLANFSYVFGKLKTAKSTEDTLTLIQTHLLQRASPTFKEYIEGKKQNGVNVLDMYHQSLRNYPKYYGSILKQSEIFYTKMLTSKIERAYKRLARVYPDAKLRPNVICFGFMDDGGKSLQSGQYVGLEVLACNDKADKSELNSRMKNYLEGASYDLNRIDELITHELVHLSQFRGDENFAKTFKGTIKYIPLLAEGGATFVTDFVYDFKATIGPGLFYQEQWDYCNNNQQKLWQDFLKATNHSPFFSGINPDYPVLRVGNYLGYQVCKAYFDKAKDKKQAIKEIIEVNDWDSFVQKSGFGQ